MTRYKIGQEVEIRVTHSMARCSGLISGRARYETARVVRLSRGYAHLSTGEKICTKTGKLEKVIRATDNTRDGGEE